jgi:hypothetical protein
MREIAMNKLLSIGVIALTLDVAGAAAAELPTYELTGFPITAHQVAVLGAANVYEQTPSPVLTIAGMPASPHQIAVLTPRPNVTAQTTAATLTAVGLSAR